MRPWWKCVYSGLYCFRWFIRRVFRCCMLLQHASAVNLLNQLPHWPYSNEAVPVSNSDTLSGEVWRPCLGQGLPRMQPPSLPGRGVPCLPGTKLHQHPLPSRGDMSDGKAGRPQGGSWPESQVGSRVSAAGTEKVWRGVASCKMDILRKIVLSGNCCANSVTAAMFGGVGWLQIQRSVMCRRKIRIFVVASL